MKLLFKSFVAATLLSIVFSVIPFSAQCENVSNEVFRLHILANSDSQEDQNLKMKVRDKIIDYTEKYYSKAENLEDAEKITSNILQEIANVAQNEIHKNGYNYCVKAEICNMYFNTRYYGDVTMPSGNYDALRVVIGEGKGKNWWCVMYPSLCLGASTNYEALESNVSGDEYEIMTGKKYGFKFKLVEYFEKICSFFS